MKISDLYRVRQLNEDRRVLRERIENLQRFVADSKKAKEVRDKASRRKGDDEPPEQLPDYHDVKIEISARYQNHSARVAAIQEVFDDDWLEAAEVILGRRIEKIEAEIRSLGVTL